MRKINDHKVNIANDKLEITVTDEPGSGGANHVYEITGYEEPDPTGGGRRFSGTTIISFQNGPIAEDGVNGLTQEVLIAICCDRLRSFQAGPYACRDNAVALTKLEEAQMWLQRRTLERMRRGVEGTHKV